MFVIEGLDALCEQLDDLADEIKDAAERGLNAALKDIVARAKNLAPEDLGQLRNSITSRVDRQGNEIDAAVIAGAGHAVYVEMGTGPRGQASDKREAAPVGATYTTHGWVYRDPKTGNFYYTEGQPAKPFLYPAYKQVSVKEKVAASVNDALKGG